MTTPAATEAAKNLHQSAVAVFRQGDPERAAALLQQAIALDDRFAMYVCNLGVMLMALGRYAQAVSAYRQALSIDQSLADAHHNLGNALQAQGHADAAIEPLVRALCLSPEKAEAHNSLGVALRNAGWAHQAPACHRRAQKLRPDYVGAYNNLAVADILLGHKQEGIGSLRRALCLNPAFAEAHSNLGGALKDDNRLTDAAAACHRAMRIEPGDARALNNLAGVLQQMDRLNESEQRFRGAIALDPAHGEAYTNLGGARTAQGQPEQALTCFARTLALAPDDAEGRWNRGLCRLLMGQLGAPAWQDYAWRWRVRTAAPRPSFQAPIWSGERGDGGELLLWAEQGYGDSIQFVRYADMARQLGWRVVLDVPPTLTRLFSTVAGATVAAPGSHLRPSAHCALPSLPAVFATTLGTIPAEIPYLSADPALALAWRRRLAKQEGLKIGLAWRGNPEHSNDRNRSLDAARLADAIALPGVTLVILQPDRHIAELTLFRAAGPVLDAGPALSDFADSAALIQGLDLVISVDSAVCHLTGALGLPVWTLLPFAPDWRWLRGRTDSPWYPSMRLFRQPRPGDWTAVLKQLRRALGQRVAEATGS